MDDGLILKEYAKDENGKYKDKIKLYTHELVESLTVDKLIKKGYETDTTHILLANGDATKLENAKVGTASELAEKATIVKVGEGENCVPDLKWVRQSIDNNNTNYVDTKVSKTGDTMTGSLTATSFIKKDGKDTELLLANGTVKATSDFLSSTSDDTMTGSLTATSFIKSDGLATELLLANGTVKNTSDFATSGHNHDGAYVNATGDSMSGPLKFSNNASAAAISEPFAISYDRIQSFSSIYLNANSDNSSSNEFVLITAGHGLSTSSADGLLIGKDSLKWKDIKISLEGHKHDDDYVNVTGDTMSGKLTVNNDIAIRSANISYDTSSGTLTITT